MRLRAIAPPRLSLAPRRAQSFYVSCTRSREGCRGASVRLPQCTTVSVTSEECRLCSRGGLVAHKLAFKFSRDHVPPGVPLDLVACCGCDETLHDLVSVLTPARPRAPLAPRLHAQPRAAVAPPNLPAPVPPAAPHRAWAPPPRQAPSPFAAALIAPPAARPSLGNGRRNAGSIEIEYESGPRGGAVVGGSSGGAAAAAAAGSVSAAEASATCYACNGVGHYASRCPTRSSAPVDGASGRGRRSAPGGGSAAAQGVTCYKCGQVGHFASNCPQSGGASGGASRGGWASRGTKRSRSANNSGRTGRQSGVGGRRRGRGGGRRGRAAGPAFSADFGDEVGSGGGGGGGGGGEEEEPQYDEFVAAVAGQGAGLACFRCGSLDHLSHDCSM
jgi:hypothetical protein